MNKWHNPTWIKIYRKWSQRLHRLKKKSEHSMVERELLQKPATYYADKEYKQLLKQVQNVKPSFELEPQSNVKHEREKGIAYEDMSTRRYLLRMYYQDKHGERISRNIDLWNNEIDDVEPLITEQKEDNDEDEVLAELIRLAISEND